MSKACITDKIMEESDTTELGSSSSEDKAAQNIEDKEEITGVKQESSEGCHSALKLMGLELAPLRIPLHRRLETLAVLQWWFCFMFLGLASILLSLFLIFTRFYWVVLLLIAWIFIDRQTPSRGGRRFQSIRNWKIWVHMRNYFPIHLVKTAELDPKHNYVLGFHPHGIMGMGAFVNFCTEATNFSQTFPGITPYLLTLRGWFFFPLTRDYLMSGGLCDVSRESLDWILGKSGPGNAAVLVVGGAVESLEAHPQAHRLFLSKRKGFIRKAMAHGAHLVPLYSFGETDIYFQMPNPEGSFLRRLQHFLTKNIGFAPPLYHGRGIFNYSMGLLPYRKPIHTVIGAPIPVEKNTNPTSEQVATLHQKYMEALVKLFEDNKTKYGVSEDRKLSII